MALWVGAGIFIVIGEAGTIAGNLVTLSFILAALIALVCGYSLVKFDLFTCGIASPLAAFFRSLLAM